MPLTQADRLIGIDTPLGPDVLLLQSFAGREAISRLFYFEAELVSEDASISFDRVIGQAVSLRIAVRGHQQRFLHGYVSRFTQSSQDSRFTYYRAYIVPWLWFLTRTADCRIFQNMTVPDIIAKIFNDLGFSDFRQDLEGSFEPLDYCVQYRETDFNFVSRLMEQYGIFYFFEHEENKHTLVLGDSPNANKPCPKQSSARCAFASGNLENEDVISACQIDQELRPGKYHLTDYNFETPSTSLAATLDSVVDVGGNKRFEIYDYPGDYEKKPQGEDLVKLRIQEEEATHLVLSGASSCRAFGSGYRFDLEEHYRDDLNQSYVLLEVQHSASAGEYYSSGGSSTVGETYGNSFTASPHSFPYRAARITPKPVVQGTQTAVVVGPSGEEIYTDKYGRVKVQFHWDREGKRNEHSSCWIRVSQPWAGKNWGSVSLPRMGQEVIVDFLEGDPDRPIITGRVYNAEQMPPYALPANQTQSGTKSRSSKGGGAANFNEIRMEDKKGSEELYIHAEKDESHIVENDQSINVGHDKTETVGNNETITIVNDRTETVSGNETLTVAKNRTRTVTQNETVTVALTRTHTVGVNEAISVGAAQEVTVGAARTLTVGAAQATTIGADHTESIGANHSENIGSNHSADIGGDQSFNVSKNRSADVGENDNLKVGKKLVIDAGEQISIKTGSASIVMKKDGTINIQGKNITVKGSGEMVIDASKNITMTGKKILQN
jgi:type VI secretion system secreted protein VgrG